MTPGSATLDGNVVTEAFGDDRRPLVLFGAGHVGRALVLALAPLPFAVTWVDPRPDAFPAHVPANVTLRPARPSRLARWPTCRPARFVAGHEPQPRSSTWRWSMRRLPTAASPMSG